MIKNKVEKKKKRKGHLRHETWEKWEKRERESNRLILNQKRVNKHKQNHVNKWKETIQ